MRRIRIRIHPIGFIAATAFALAACGGGHSSSVMPAGGAQNLPSPSSGGVPGTFTFGSKQIQSATLVKNLTTGALNLQVMVTMRDQRGLLQYAQNVNDPRSPDYHHFLTPQQIADRFGATQADYDAVGKYFKQYGLSVGLWPQRELLRVSGSFDNLGKAFGVKFGLYQHGDQQFIAPVGTPRLTANVPVAAVAGLMTARLNSTMLMLPSNAALHGNSPQQMQRAFDFSGAYKRYTGAGVNVAIVGTGPIAADDAKTFASYFNAPMAPITEVNVNDTDLCTALVSQGEPSVAVCSPAPSASPSPTPTPGVYPTATPPQFYNFYQGWGWSTPPPIDDPKSGCTLSENPNDDPSICNTEDGEAQLDTQTIASLAPGSSVLFYLGYWATPNYCAPSFYCGFALEGLQAADAEIQEIIAQDQADVVSLSYGGGEIDNLFKMFDSAGQGYGPTEFATMAAEGMAVFASSGDSGQYNCRYTPGGLCATYPATDPNVTAVGGVTAPLDADGTVKGEITAWGDQTAGGFAVGSGGGISQVFMAPSWQNGIVSGGFRGIPDVAMMGDPNSGVTVVTNADFNFGGSGIIDVGGTSLAAPQMASMWALVLQACRMDSVCSAKYLTATPGGNRIRMGNAAPYLYAIYNSKAQYADSIFDVLYGDVSATQTCGSSGAACTPPPGAAAATGWDEMTGVGVPFAGHLINDVLTNVGGTSPNLP